MISKLDKNFLTVMNRGGPSFWCGEIDRNAQNFMSFETRLPEYSGISLQILEKKL
ncbi:MAG: hypothetical protein WC155_00110 [Candidatus Cloacimonadales bacterium]